MALSTPPSQHTRQMLQLLVQKNKISVDQAKQIWNDSQGDAAQAEQIAGEMKVSEADVTAAKAEAMGVPFVDLHKSKPSSESKRFDRRRNARSSQSDRRFTRKATRSIVAMDDPKNFHAIEDLRIKTGHVKFAACLAPPSQLEAFRNGTNGFAAQVKTKRRRTRSARSEFGRAAATGPTLTTPASDGDAARPEAGSKIRATSIRPKAATSASAQAEDTDSDDNEVAELDPSSIAGDKEAGEEAPIIRIVNTILLYAIKEGASDIHIEPQSKGVRVRYRIDGVLHEQMKIPQYVLNPLISRVKIMSEMNIAERRIPQDGRIKITMQGKEFDMRVNTCPSVFGEKIVMRILDKSSVMLGLDKIGLIRRYAGDAFGYRDAAQRHADRVRPDRFGQNDDACIRCSTWFRRSRKMCQPSKTRSSISCPV